MFTPLYIILGLIGLGIVYVIVAYNRFVGLGMQSKEALADIDVQLKRRYDLIPNLVETVKGYASHESGTLEKVIAARNSAMSAMSGGVASPHEQALAENAFAGTLKSLFALSESYPDLKANTNFIELQRELSDTENKIQAARRFYNGMVRELNTAIGMFPGNMIAKLFGFSQAEYFDLADDSVETQPVAVKF